MPGQTSRQVGAPKVAKPEKSVKPAKKEKDK